MEVEQKARLVTQNVEFSVEGFEAIEFVGLVASLDQGFEQVVEVGDDAIAQQELVIAGEAIENGDVPGDQIVGLLDNWKFRGHPRY